MSFVSKKIRKAGVYKVRFLIPLNGKQEKLDLQVRVASVRPTDKGCICSGELPVTDEAMLTLERVLSQAPRANLGIGARRSERYRISLRVLSNDLPGYRGVTVDLSLHGAQLSVQGVVAVGKQVQMTIELDAAATPKVTLRSRVVWCKEVGDRSKTSYVGLEFMTHDPPNQEILEKYYRVMVSRAGSDVMQRTIEGGEFYIRPDDNVPPGYPGGF